MKFTRREFVATTALGSASLALDLHGQAKAPDYQTENHAPSTKPKAPVIICAHNGYNYLDRGYAVLTSGGDTLDAVMQVITGPEGDPNDDSVGLGGLPNEECVVELDSCCMHGPTRMAGSVAGVHDIKNVSLLAKTVMEHTGHVMLVGEGASHFGLVMGFPKENLLTERSRKTWQLWRETMSNDDWWGPGLASPNFKFPDEAGNLSELDNPLIDHMYKLATKIGIEPSFRMAAIERVLNPPTGTIHCSTVNSKGEMSGATTTSGLGVEDSWPRWRFADYRRRQLHRSGCRLGRRDRQWRGEHQDLRRAHHRREHASRHVAQRRRHGCAQAHRAQL